MEREKRELVNCGTGQRGKKADRRRDGQREKGKKEACDSTTPMDMNMMVNCVASFKSDPVVVFDVHPSKSAGTGSNISSFNHQTCTHTHTPAAAAAPPAVTQSCNSY